MQSSISAPGLNRVKAVSPAGAIAQLKTAEVLLSGLSGASVEATNLIPAGSIVLGVVIRVTTLITGTLSSFDVLDNFANGWASAVAKTLGTTTGVPNFVSAIPVVFASAGSITLSANGGTFSAGAVRITVVYFTITAPTS